MMMDEWLCFFLMEREIKEGKNTKSGTKVKVNDDTNYIEDGRNIQCL
jgi:hypothetical protein